MLKTASPNLVTPFLAKQGKVCNEWRPPPDVYKRQAQVIEAYKDKEGSLIMVLHAAQEIFGYLPMQLQELDVYKRQMSPSSL